MVQGDANRRYKTHRLIFRQTQITPKAWIYAVRICRLYIRNDIYQMRDLRWFRMRVSDTYSLKDAIDTIGIGIILILASFFVCLDFLNYLLFSFLYIRIYDAFGNIFLCWSMRWCI